MPRAMLVLLALPMAALGLNPEMFSAFFDVAKPAFEFVGDAWKAWSPSGEWPSIEMEIIQPPIGLKQSPKGTHPAKYLQELPELKDLTVNDAIIKYVNKNGNQISISSPSDWHMFFQSLEGDGPASRLRLNFQAPTAKSWSLLRAGQQAVQKVSEKMRTFGKELLSGVKVEETALQKEMDVLKDNGFTEFEGKGLLFEELGYSKQDWPELIDTMTEFGIPEVWTKSLKLAAKAKRGSVKSLLTSSFKDGVRTMMYMKFQVFPAERDLIDGLFAIYKLDASMEGDQTTSPKTEQTFEKYVEMDAHMKWKREVKQILDRDKDEL